MQKQDDQDLIMQKFKFNKDAPELFIMTMFPIWKKNFETAIIDAMMRIKFNGQVTEKTKSDDKGIRGQ
jgi:hypothetical protein